MFEDQCLTIIYFAIVLDPKYFEIAQSFDFKFLNNTDASNLAELNPITVTLATYPRSLLFEYRNKMNGYRQPI
ncbi:MAG: hypothetical protein EZS28_048295 [Streblomastix strix]|uniref:Uncharacterized protein n=1 Tax=Streblomastix strix TaxID=222440 RepID=A0A5J4TD71_9EUKA|nr:MAG: hypothetical protein EZS28_048295 [Streblomastix strix]